MSESNMAESGTENIIFRSAGPTDVVDIVALIREMGWLAHIPEVTMECEVFGYNSFLLAFDDKKALLGLCGSFIQDDNYGYLGLVVVTESHRRRGIARQMLQHVMPKLGARNVILDSIPMYRSLYASFGFVQDCEDTIRIKFKLPKLVTGVSPMLPDNIHRVTDESIPAVMDYDKSLHTFGYRKQVEALLKDCQSLCAKGQNGITGLLVINFSPRIGLYADDPVTAELLLKGMITICSRTSDSHDAVTYYVMMPANKLSDLLLIMTRLGIKNEDPEVNSHRMSTRG